MVNAIYASIWLFALWKWGDWRKLANYYPTILFFILGDFLYLYLLSDHYPMWRYVPADIDREMGVTNVHVSLSVIAIKYPATILIYLGNFPEGKKIKKWLYILLWVGIYTINETIDIKLNIFGYYNGWNLAWSILFTLVMFIVLRIHHTKPFHAWLLSAAFLFILWQIFDVPTSVFR
ncbi:CBO0543 family protein [Cytobacillus sp. FJAT-54145]|uniref:CBO0543 family protein n=1 Tax=Cytobacillus spartinae TaxID=3299023 RepID=A0ABW6KAQ1_9BACI